MPCTASIIIPTRARPAYLEVALTSIVPQADAAGAEVLVIDDAGPSPAVRTLVEHLGARYESHPGQLGLNVARNTGVKCSTGELVMFVDDDVRVQPGWLGALLDAASEHPQVDVFTGPIEPRLEGPAPRSCGREGPPITALDLGTSDTDAPYAWGANMAIRRAALERVGPFEVSLEHGGDEQEWQERLRTQTPGARILYVAGAAVEHRRAGADARLSSLSSSGPRTRARGRGASTRAGNERRRFGESCYARRLPRARHPAPLPGRTGDGRAQRRASARSTARTQDTGLTASRRGRLPLGRERHRRRPRRHAPGHAGRGSERLGAGQRPAPAAELAARHGPPLRQVLVLGVVRPEHSALARVDARRAAALPP